MDTIWPMIITVDRYHGTYSGGKYNGFVSHQVPEGSRDSDVETSVWWTQWGGHPAVAVGNTLQEVERKLIEQNRGEEFPPRLPNEAFAEVDH